MPLSISSGSSNGASSEAYHLVVTEFSHRSGDRQIEFLAEGGPGDDEFGDRCWQLGEAVLYERGHRRRQRAGSSSASKITDQLDGEQRVPFRSVPDGAGEVPIDAVTEDLVDEFVDIFRTEADDVIAMSARSFECVEPVSHRGVEVFDGGPEREHEQDTSHASSQYQ